MIICSAQQQYRSIVVLNGETPDSLFFKQGIPIIAVDGGLASIGVQPDLVVGDLDSVNPNLRTGLNTIYLSDQDYCDFSKAIAHLRIVITHFSLSKNTKISLLGIPKAQISTKGLKWELHLSNLAFPGKNSCFNRSLSSKVSIEVHSDSNDLFRNSK